MRTIIIIFFTCFFYSESLANKIATEDEINKISKDYEMYICLLRGNGKEDKVLAHMGIVKIPTHINTNLKDTGYYIVIKRKRSDAMYARIAKNLDEKINFSLILGEKFKSVSMRELTKMMKQQKIYLEKKEKLKGNKLKK